jgi:hypothetical protein
MNDRDSYRPVGSSSEKFLNLNIERWLQVKMVG